MGDHVLHEVGAGDRIRDVLGAKVDEGLIYVSQRLEADGMMRHLDVGMIAEEVTYIVAPRPGVYQPDELNEVMYNLARIMEVEPCFEDAKFNNTQRGTGYWNRAMMLVDESVGVHSQSVVTMVALTDPSLIKPNNKLSGWYDGMTKTQPVGLHTESSKRPIIRRNLIHVLHDQAVADAAARHDINISDPCIYGIEKYRLDLNPEE